MLATSPAMQQLHPGLLLSVKAMAVVALVQLFWRWHGPRALRSRVGTTISQLQARRPATEITLYWHLNSRSRVWRLITKLHDWRLRVTEDDLRLLVCWFALIGCRWGFSGFFRGLLINICPWITRRVHWVRTICNTIFNMIMFYLWLNIMWYLSWDSQRIY